MAEDSDSEEGYEPVAWASQTPETRIAGRPVEIIYGGSLDSSEAQNKISFGLALEDPRVVKGTLFRNESRGDDETTAESVGEDEPRPTDYRIADTEDRETTIVKDSLTTGESGPNVYDEVDEFADETVIVWYSGMAAERIARSLDFNGMPFASSYGLFQVANEWRGADGSTRGELKDSGLGPRVARLPLLRFAVDDDTLVEDFEAGPEVLIDISRWQGGRAYEAHVLDAAAFEAEAGSLDADLPRNDSGFVDADAEFEFQYNEDAASVLDQAEYGLYIYDGDAWEDGPDGVARGGGTGDFDVQSSTPDVGEDGFTDDQREFVTTVVDEITGTGLTPEEAFEGGIEGLIGANTDAFTIVPDADDVLEAVYEQTPHLDVEDLETAEA